MLNARDCFFEVLKRDLYPLLRADGFKGSGGNFSRLVGDRMDCLNIQGASAGDRCAVNLGSHYSFLPAEGGIGLPPPDLKRLRPWDCAFRDRMRKQVGHDQWWPYGNHPGAPEATAQDLIDTYSQRASLFFSRFEPFPDVFLSVTPAGFETGETSIPWGSTYVRAALTMARVMKHLGQQERCREFVELGLSGATPHLAADFQALLETD